MIKVASVLRLGGHCYCFPNHRIGVSGFESPETERMDAAAGAHPFFNESKT